MKELSRSLLLADAGGDAEAVKEGKDQRGKARRSGAAKQQDGDV